MTGTMEQVSGYVPVSRRALDLEDYIDIARRHSSWIAGPVLAGIVISTVVAFVMPNVYVSQAEMQITPAQVSESIVKSTVNDRLTERIVSMEQEILSRTSLSQIIQDPRLDLYKTERAKEPLDDVIERMRTRYIHIKPESTPGDTRGASAFFISFEYQDAVKARDTVQALVTRFTDQNQVTQATQQTVVKNMVHDELSDAKVKLDQLNEQLTRFRVENSGKLPEQSALTIARLTSLEQKSTTINDDQNRLAQERVMYENQLKALDGQIQVFNMYEKEDAAGLQNVTPLAKQQNQRLAQDNATIENLESQLAQQKRIYKPGFPEIRDTESRLDELRKERDALQKKQDDEFAKLQTEAEVATSKPVQPQPKKTNFQTAQQISKLQTDISATQAQLKTLEMQREALMADQKKTKADIDAAEAKLAATSGIEAKYAELVENQKAASLKFEELQRKQELTEESSDLLTRKAGEQLYVLDVPNLPTQPSKPNRWLIVGAGVGISFIIGLALAGVQEAKDSSLKNLKDVRAYTNLPVLSSIPLLENTMLVRRKRRIAYVGWAAAVIVGLMAVAASLYYHYTTAV
jgi:succinoglycan biosynthesis transport protein ExoP